jgi:subfamily B ATP-binding cassette protein MsbA
MRALRPSPRRLAFTTLLLLAVGALEGATVGLLVPLLAVLTGTTSAAHLPVLGTFLAWLGADHSIGAFALVIAGTVLVKNGLAVLGNHSASVLRSSMLIELRRQLLERIVHAPPAILEKHTSGEIVDVFGAEAYRVNRFLEACLVLLQRIIIALAYLVAMLALSWRLTAAAMVLGFLVATTAQRLGRRVMDHGREVSHTSGQLGRQVTEIVGGLRVIRTTASAPSFSRTFDEHSTLFARADAGSAFALAVQQAGIETIGVCGAVGLVTLAHTLWLESGSLDVPHFLAFGFGLIRLLPSLNLVYATYGLVAVSVGSIEHALRWLSLPTFPKRPFGTAPVPRLEQGIRCENLGFSYDNGHTPLSSLSFFLPAGRTLAVIGPSGAGKSTLANLILRLREPTRGTIEFDGVDYWSFAPEDFHRAVGFVDQESFLFNLSIAENIACGRRGIDRAAILAALRLVQLGELIERLPEGLDTVLAERGATLSGGQRQRMAIARAIVCDPQVLVLDEPTSALDVETEREVMQAIYAASAGRTTLIITHRGAILKHATQQLDLATGIMSDCAGEPLPALQPAN